MKAYFKLILRTENFELNTLIDIIEHKSSLIEITRFGYTEPLKNKIETQNLSAVTELFKEYLSIILKGKKKLWISGSASSEGLLMFGGGIELKDAELKNINDLIAFIQLFSRNGQLLYGYLSSEDEFDEKHKVIDSSRVGWEGVSKWDFLEYSPGIHWYTIIGKDLVKTIGKNKFENIEGVTYCNPEDNSIAFHLSSNINLMENRLEELEKIEKKIGEEFFYNRNIDKKSLSHPDEFKKFLRNLGRGY